MDTNKKRTLTLHGKVVLTILILTLSIATFYGFNKNDAERAIIEQEIIDITKDIEYIKARQFELEAMLNHVEFIDTSEVETSSIQKWRDPIFDAIVRATWRLETGNGTSLVWLRYNNAGGIKCGSDYCTYESEEQGLNALEMLLQDYYTVYGTDFKRLRERYCENCGIEDLNEFTAIYQEEISKWIN